MASRWVIGGTLAAIVMLTNTALAGADARGPGGDPEFPRETEALVAATVSLFEAAEAAHAPAGEPAFGFGPRATPAGLSPSDETLSAFPDAYGPVRHLTGYRITWYPVDRLLGAVDFMGTWDRTRNLVCGYVTWDLTNPDDPALQGVMTNYIDISLLSDASPAEVEAVLTEANCAFSDIEANYAVFE